MHKSDTNCMVYRGQMNFTFTIWSTTHLMILQRMVTHSDQIMGCVLRIQRSYTRYL